MSNSRSCWISANFRSCLLLQAGSAHANTRKRFCRLRKPEKRFGNLFGGESAWFLLFETARELLEPVARTGYPSTGSPGPRWGPPIKGGKHANKPFGNGCCTNAGSKVPSALPANTRDVCVALDLVCACSCEQETVSSRIPAKNWNLTHGL